MPRLPFPKRIALKNSAHVREEPASMFYTSYPYATRSTPNHFAECYRGRDDGDIQTTDFLTNGHPLGEGCSFLCG